MVDPGEKFVRRSLLKLVEEDFIPTTITMGNFRMEFLGDYPNVPDHSIKIFYGGTMLVRIHMSIWIIDRIGRTNLAMSLLNLPGCNYHPEHVREFVSKVHTLFENAPEAMSGVYSHVTRLDADDDECISIRITEDRGCNAFNSIGQSIYNYMLLAAKRDSEA